MDKNEQDFTYDRRIANHAVDQERRRQNDMSARVAVLEIKVSTASDRLEESYNTQTRIMDKLDSHITQSIARDTQLQQTIGQVTNAVTTLSTAMNDTNTTLKGIAEMASASNTQILKWDTIMKTIAKVAAIVAIVIGAAWSVFTFIEGKAHEKVALTDIPTHISNEITVNKPN